jgi:hypothetical protein
MLSGLKLLQDGKELKACFGTRPRAGKVYETRQKTLRFDSGER